MNKFTIRGTSDKYLEVINENTHEYLIKYHGYSSEKIINKEDTISKALFDLCLRTGYFTKKVLPQVLSV